MKKSDTTQPQAPHFFRKGQSAGQAAVSRPAAQPPSRQAVSSLLQEAAALLTKNGIDEADLNAQWLLASALGIGRLELLAQRAIEVPAEAESVFKKNVALKVRGWPLAYILGEQNFCGLRLKVDKSVLVPRPETEELVELVCASLNKLMKPQAAKPASGPAIALLDFGTGSGAIALALAARFPALKVTAVDVSARALKRARENARLLGLTDRVRFLRADSLGAVPGRYKVIVSNPPYIPTGAVAGLQVEVRFEPKVALDGGPDGLKIARQLIKEATRSLEKGGELFIETGAGQWKGLAGSFSSRLWSKSRALKDFSGKERFVYGRMKE